MGNTNSTVEDNTLNDKNLVHSGSELNIGFVNVHTETINHGIKVFFYFTWSVFNYHHCLQM